MENRRSALVIAGVGVVAAVGLGLASRRNASPRWAELAQAAADLDARVGEATARAQARAQTLARLPRLAWAVATDETTVLDLSAEELSLQPKPGESIQIAQVARRTGSVVPLLRMGAEVRPLPPLEAPGLYLSQSDQTLYVTAVVDVKPRVRADVLRGVLAVSRAVDVTALAARLGALGVGARLETTTGIVDLSGLKAGGEMRAVSLALQGDQIRGQALLLFTLPTTSPASTALWVAALFVLVFSLVGAALTWRRKWSGWSRRGSWPRSDHDPPAGGVTFPAEDTGRLRIDDDSSKHHLH